MGRIVALLQGLFDDLREWIDLRLDLAVLEVEERVDEVRNKFALGLTVLFFGFFAAVFSLVTVALGLGWLLGHPFWGFLAVTVSLILIVVLLRATRPSLVPPSNLFRSIRGESRTEGREETNEAADEASAEKTNTRDPSGRQDV